MNSNGVVLFKFGEQRWIDKIIEGKLSFACAGAFINEYKRSKNEIMGDQYEAVFAKLYPDDPRINEMKQKLGRDLESIKYNDYILLRRKSARLIPIFCMYGYKEDDIIDDIIEPEIGKNIAVHKFDERMYIGFAKSINARNVVVKSCRFTQLALRVPEFIMRLVEHNAWNKFEMHPVNYKYFEQDTFFIEPTRSYKELFYKFPDYKYQLETRISIPSIQLVTCADRYEVEIREFKDDDYRKSYEPIVFKTTVTLKNGSGFC